MGVHIKKLRIHIALAVLALAVSIAFILIANQRIETLALAARVPDTSIIRLHDVETGEFFCSGVVISNTRIVTAAHCLVVPGLFGYEVRREVEVRDRDNSPGKIIAKFESGNPRQDLATLKGNFQKFDQRPIITAADTLNRIFLSGRNLLACGYPEGGALRCSPFQQRHRTLFFFSGTGYLYPGMSGGPVIDEDTGAVIAVNQAVNEAGEAIVSPLVELFENLGIKP